MKGYVIEVKRMYEDGQRDDGYITADGGWVLPLKDKARVWDSREDAEDYAEDEACDSKYNKYAEWSLNVVEIDTEEFFDVFTFEAFQRKYKLKIIDIAHRFYIPYRTVQNWAGGQRECPSYVIRMMDEILGKEKKAGKMEIVGKKARYIVEDINGIGDYYITIYDHEEYEDGQTWMVTNFDYQSSIDRIEAGKKMLLKSRR